MIRKPRVGVVGFSDGDEGVHEELKDIVQAQLDAIVAALTASDAVEVVVASTLVNSVELAKNMANELAQSDVDGVIFSYGVFSFPNFSAVAAKFSSTPILLAANLNPDWPGMVAMLAAGGALNHLGINHFRVAGDIKEADVLAKYLEFAKCAYAVSSLKGQTYGLVGGRSLGMYSATVSMQDWMDQFGVDIEHIDQSEILRVAETIPEAQVEKAFKWLSERVKSIEYDGKQLTPEKLKTQIRHYEATKELVKKNKLDFLGVKCHYEMSRHYCTQCLSAAFMNDPYDWDGAKEPVVFACEADSDAALTMQILKTISGGPVIFMDIRHWDAEEEVMVFCNCGSQSTYYAGRSDVPEENLKNVTLYPALDIYSGGGAHVNCMTKAGAATVARLCRVKGEYRMVLFPVELVELAETKMAETTKEWPHNFAKLPFSHELFLEEFDANHCHAVYGDVTHEIEMVCKMLGVEVIRLDKMEAESK